MLSVTQAASKLNVSSSRVRKLIADGALKAEKVGNAWVIQECEVTSRLMRAPRAGRPKEKDKAKKPKRDFVDLHELYINLKKGNFVRPSALTIAEMEDKNEAGFMLCVCDYFLNIKQREEIEKGVY